MEPHGSQERTTASDSGLLLLARDVLLEAGFAVEEIPGEPDFVLAENRYFVVAVAATPTIGQLFLAEALIEAALTTRLAASDAGPKLWDSYMVLLTQERSVESDEASRALYEINYDTSRLRRIAHIGVQATPSGLRKILASFVAPHPIADASVSDGPLRLLLESLADRGISRDLASRAVGAFEQGASLADVL